jgi:predicted nucleic acid-binding protein
MKDNHFWDTNLWIYLLAESNNEADKQKKMVLENLLREENEIHISVQVLNETANVLLKKYNLPILDAQKYIEKISQITTVHPLTEETVSYAFHLKTKYAFSWYDSLIVSAAKIANCTILYSEDLHNGLVVEETLVVKNPF